MSDGEIYLRQVRVQDSDGSMTGKITAIYVPPGPAKRAMARVEVEGMDLDLLAVVEPSDLRSEEVRLHLTKADREAAEVLPDDGVARFVHEALEVQGVLPPPKKIRPTAPDPDILGPIKIIKPGMTWHPEF
jgi:hypothetical protein